MNLFPLVNLIFVLLSCLICELKSQNFIKDLDLNVQFPPLIDRKENIPTGHLRPLGWQIRADTSVNEESAAISPGNLFK